MAEDNGTRNADGWGGSRRAWTSPGRGPGSAAFQRRCS